MRNISKVESCNNDSQLLNTIESIKEGFLSSSRELEQVLSSLNQESINDNFKNDCIIFSKFYTERVNNNYIKLLNDLIRSLRSSITPNPTVPEDSWDFD